MITHILFPADYSKATRNAAPLVAEMARRTGAKLTVLHVLEMPDRRMTDWLAYLEMGNTGELIRERRKEFEAPLRAAFAGIPGVRFAFRHGDPATRILDAARRGRVDLIMIPTNGLGVYRRLLIGSVCAKILHDAQCAVWTIAPHAVESKGGLLCAVDLSPDSNRLLQAACEIGGQLHLDVTLAHVAATSDSEDPAMRKLDDLARIHKLTAAPILSRGGVAEAVDALTDRTGASLLLIGRGHMAAPLGRLRTAAYAIIRDSKCPVISV